MAIKRYGEIKMPENYIALFSTTDKETSKQMIKEADKQIYRIISDIRNENEFETITPSGLGGTIKSGIINTVFYKTIISAKGFHYTDKCIGCGKCVELCPLNNINLKNKNQFGKITVLIVWHVFVVAPLKLLSIKIKLKTEKDTI